MAYTLENFCNDTRQTLTTKSGYDSREEVRQNLEKLLTNTDFISEHCGPDAENGVHTLFEDNDLGFCVLAHIRGDEPRKESPPHDHGPSWAVYGQAIEFTDMVEWTRRDDGKKKGHAELERSKHYRLDPPHAGLYDIGAIHSINPAPNSRYIRVTGTDLTKIDRLRYKPDSNQVEVGHPSG